MSTFTSTSLPSRQGSRAACVGEEFERFLAEVVVVVVVAFAFAGASLL